MADLPEHTCAAVLCLLRVPTRVFRPCTCTLWRDVAVVTAGPLRLSRLTDYKLHVMYGSWGQHYPLS